MATSVCKRPVARENVGRALLVASDSSLVDQCSRALKGIDVAMTHAPMVRDAINLVDSQKFEAFVFDTSMDTPFLDLLSEVRSSSSNSRAVILAIAPSPSVSSMARKAGASFVLEKPVPADALTRTLRAAHGMIVREYRRYFRHSLQMNVTVQSTVTGQIEGESINISEGGMGVRLAYALPVGTEALIRFRLPGQPTDTISRASVTWTSENQKLGLNFMQMSAATKAQLQEWLAMRLEERMPALARKSPHLI